MKCYQLQVLVAVWLSILLPCGIEQETFDPEGAANFLSAKQQRRFRDIKEAVLTHMAEPAPEPPKQVTPGDLRRSWLGVWAY